MAGLSTLSGTADVVSRNSCSVIETSFIYSHLVRRPGGVGRVSGL
jgi:hypothetical protein